jgi:7,8-dihydroneopterin aldolase/epimerase/oxygenase
METMRESDDVIFLHELEVETVVGIWAWERKIRQTVSINLEMGADVRRAAAEDHIDAALNYKAVAKRVQEFVGGSSFQLVETLTEKIAALVLEEFDVPWIEVRVSKPGAIRGARDVGVRIRRSSEVQRP